MSGFLFDWSFQSLQAAIMAFCKNKNILDKNNTPSF